MLVCLYIDGYEIDTWKNCIAYEAAILFTEVDAVKLERPYSDESKDADSDYPFPVEPSDQEPHKGYQYRSTAGHLESTQGEESLKSSNRLLSRIRFSFALYSSRNSWLLALWEMRMTGRAGIARALYFAAQGRRLIVVRAFVKKTQKTSRREIDIALRRMRGLPQ